MVVEYSEPTSVYRRICDVRVYTDVKVSAAPYAPGEYTTYKRMDVICCARTERIRGYMVLAPA